MPPAAKSEEKPDKVAPVTTEPRTDGEKAAAAIDPAVHQAALDEIEDLRARLARERQDASEYIRGLESRAGGDRPRRPLGRLRTYRAVHTLRFLRDGDEVEVPAGESFDAEPGHLKGLRAGSFKLTDE